MVGVHRKGLKVPELGGGAWGRPESYCTHHGKEVVIAFDLGRHLGELLGQMHRRCCGLGRWR